MQALVNIFHDRIQFDSNQFQKYLHNVCGAERKILGIVYPHSEHEIIELVTLCQNKQIPLYPISKGCNYGLGSRLPVQDNHLIVDLSRMNRIIFFDADLGVIRIEPGVTQHDIALFLQQRNAEFIFNVTGSAADSSVMGNALERGVAHYGSRASEIINMEIILGTGEKISTGIGTATNNCSYNNYPHSLGPDLRGLFLQSNFGIITAMTIRLLPKTESIAIITIQKYRSTTLEDFVNHLRIAKQKNLLTENLHISNQARRLSIAASLIAGQAKNITIEEATSVAKKYIKNDWAATASLRGDRQVIKTQINRLRQFIKVHGKMSALIDPNLEEISDPFLSALKGVLGHAMGVPCSDALLSLGYGLKIKLNTSLEQSDIGTLFLIPVLPFRGQDLVNVTSCIEQHFKKYFFDAYMTFNLVDSVCLEGVINIVYSRSILSLVANAHACIQETLTALEQLGYPPMRLSIFQKTEFLNEANRPKNILNKIQNIFDPNKILARGRYE